MSNFSSLEHINGLDYLDSGNFFLLAGPCVVEGESITLQIAERIKRICDDLKIPFVFKASYRKANRSSIDSFTGFGDEVGMRILEKVKTKLDLPIISDIHSASEAVIAAEVCDILQIPAFLCRQTDILEAAAKTNRVVNIKKGQFLSASSMRFAAEKVKSAGNNNILLTERGSMFGYQDLIVDMRSIPIMQAIGYPVVMDITHSLQQPNQEKGVTGGNPAMIETIARAAVAIGVDGLFIETHPDPGQALSDGANMLPLDQLKILLERLIRIRQTIIQFQEQP